MIYPVSLKATNALSTFDEVIKAARLAGCNLAPLMGDSFKCADDFAKSVLGQLNHELHVVVLPSPKLLRFLADEIEKLR